MGSCLNVCGEILKKEIEIHADHIKETCSPRKDRKEKSKVKIREKAEHEIEKTVDNSLTN